MSIESVKARSFGTYIVLLILFVVQIPILYVLLSDMNKKYAQIDVAGGLRAKAIEITAILDRHIMTGNESLEALYQKKKLEYPLVINKLRTGSDRLAAIDDTQLVARLDVVDSAWNELLLNLEQGMVHGDEMRLKKEEIEASMLPFSAKLGNLSASIEETGNVTLMKQIENIAALDLSAIEMVFMFEKYIITFQEKDALTAELTDDMQAFDGLMAGLGTAIRSYAGDNSSLFSAYSGIENDWKVKKELLGAAFAANEAYQSKMNELVGKYTPQLIKSASGLNVAIEAKASSDAQKSLAIIVVCVLIAAIVSIIFMWMTGALILRPLLRIKDTVELFAKGDLTSRADVKVRLFGREFKDEIYTLGKSVDEMAMHMGEIIGHISESSDYLASGSEELSASATQIAKGTEAQSGRADHVATASQEMSATVIEVAKNASGASESAKQANETALRGGEIVSKTIDSMNGIALTARESSDVIASLGTKSEEIGKIIRVIDDIADQTNLLALNAAIEAARAGEQGRGFAVVADEVKKLAERTSVATKEIGEMIIGIQTETEKAIVSMDKEVKVVEEGVELAEEAGASLRDIVGQVEEVSGVILQIATASEQQAAAADQISGDIEGVASITKETSVVSQQIVSASTEMAKLASSLQTSIAMFKVSSQVLPDVLDPHDSKLVHMMDAQKQRMLIEEAEDGQVVLESIS